VKRSVPTIVVEGRTLLREGIASMLDDTCYKVVGSAACPKDIPDLKRLTRRDSLIILGISTGIDQVLVFAQEVRRNLESCKIVAIGEHLHDLNRQRLLSSGIDAIIFNVRPSHALVKALDLVFQGQQLVILGKPVHGQPDHQSSSLLDHDDVPTDAAESPKRENGNGASRLERAAPNVHGLLSEREQQILFCLVRGGSNKSIARTLSITAATVKAHLQSILRKISVHNRTQAALWAVENGLLSSNSMSSGGEPGAYLRSSERALPDSDPDLAVSKPSDCH
jgi:two-component system nitrate/nitrite response regulator NarL